MNFSDFCCQINKLKIAQKQLEKCEKDLIIYVKINCDTALEDEFEKLRRTREQELNKIRREFQKNRQSLKCVSSMLTNENISEIDVTELKDNLLSLENNINELKNHTNSELELLAKSENSLCFELTNIEMKLNDLNRHQNDTNKISVYSAKNNPIEECLYQEVKDFADFLNKTGGHEGGWSEDDHLIFVKIFNKMKSQKKIVSFLQTLLPDMTEEHIVDHINWYNSYLELRSKQKEAIEKWRQSKNENKTEEIPQNDANNKRKLIKKQNNVSEIKEKLQQWKLEKQHRIERDLEVQSKNRTKIKGSEKQKKMKQMEVKQEVEKWKIAKRAKEKADKLEKEIISLKERERKISLANKLIREFQSQDHLYINRRLSKLQVNATSCSEDNVEYHSNKVTRDPERIFKATRQWMARTASDERDKNGNIFAGHITLKNIPKLAVPDWRKTIT